MSDIDLSDAVYGNAAFRIDTEPSEPEIEADAEEAHPITIVLDTVVKTSDSYLKSKKKPQPNRDAYNSLARPNLDEAFKQLIPVESEAQLNPYILLIMGIGGMALVYAPLLLDIIDKKLNEEKPKKKQLPPPHTQTNPDLTKTHTTTSGSSAPPDPEIFKPISIPDEDDPTNIPTVNLALLKDTAGKWQERISQFEG